MYDVAVVKYEKPFESLKNAVDLAGGLEGLSSDSKVFIKPNFCLWHEAVNFPKYGVLTTARMIEDMVHLLKEHDVRDITLLEGIVEVERKPESLVQLLAKGMGLDVLTKHYGVKIIDVMKGSFTKVTAGDVTLSVNKDILDADYVINMPVLKTHNSTIVSLGMKNLKGMLNIASRKRCHNADRVTDLDYHVAKLPDILSPSLTVIDGVYSLERGPAYAGRAHRSNIIVVSRDLISADKVGATLLGFDPQSIPHIAQAAKTNGRPAGLSDVNIRGEIDVKTALKPHAWNFEQSESGDVPAFFERAGIKGLTYPNEDNTMCTYCAALIPNVIWGILMAENRDKLFDDIEILHGKIYEPTEGHKHTILFGECQVKRNSEHEFINHCVKIKGCPPSMEELFAAYAEVGIKLPGDFLQRVERLPETFMRNYIDKPEFDEIFYKVQ